MIDFVVSTIEGQYPFPVDMLRYDGAFPLTRADNELITKSDDSHDLYNDRTAWTVRVTSSRPATGERYASFGVHVTSETRYLKNGEVQVYDPEMLRRELRTDTKSLFPPAS